MQEAELGGVTDFLFLNEEILEVFQLEYFSGIKTWGILTLLGGFKDYGENIKERNSPGAHQIW